MFHFLWWGHFVLLFFFPFVPIHKESYIKLLEWRVLAPGLSITEVKNSYHLKISDNIVTLIKVNPTYFDIDIYSAIGSMKRNVVEWADEFNLQLVVNAGMHSLSNSYLLSGCFKQRLKVIQPDLKENFRVMALFCPQCIQFPSFALLDMKCEKSETLLFKYPSAFQSIRMIDCNREQALWKSKRQLFSSMYVLAKDAKQNAIIAFARTLLLDNQISSLLIQLPLNIRSTVYFKDDPKSCFYLKTVDTVITKVGSYVLYTFPTATNTRHWNLPNVKLKA